MLIAIPILLFFVLAGAFVRSPWVFLSTLLIPAYFLGIYVGWWGDGLGDSWELAFLIFIILGVSIAVVGLLAGRWIRDSLGRW